MPLLPMLGGHPRSGGPLLYSVGAVLNNGRYRIDKKLNKGATAVVYAATDRHSGRQVALKVVQCGSNKVPVNVVRREVTLSSSVAHENMVQLLDVFAEGTELIIVWELIAGPDLLELLNEAQGRMNEPAAAFYFVQLLRAVLHMHAMGYCHRDIKPENCMVERSTQRLKLIDFGLAKHLESVATLGVGTPDYMPPEMVRSQIKSQQRTQQQQQQSWQQRQQQQMQQGWPQQQQQQQQAQQQQQQGSAPPYDAKAVDAWALGVLLFLLVSGTYPFEDPAQPNNLAATILNVQAGRVRSLPPQVSAGCRAIIAGLLNPNPNQRTRLEALARNEWLLQSAAVHVAKLGRTLSTLFDPGNPAWILPMQYTAANTAAVAGPAAAAEAAAYVAHAPQGSAVDGMDAIMLDDTAALPAAAGNGGSVQYGTDPQQRLQQQQQQYANGSYNQPQLQQHQQQQQQQALPAGQRFHRVDPGQQMQQFTALAAVPVQQHLPEPMTLDPRQHQAAAAAVMVHQQQLLLQQQQQQQQGLVLASNPAAAGGVTVPNDSGQTVFASVDRSQGTPTAAAPAAATGGTLDIMGFQGYPTPAIAVPAAGDAAAAANGVLFRPTMSPDSTPRRGMTWLPGFMRKCI